jgi:hypothetical protein
LFQIQLNLSSGHVPFESGYWIDYLSILKSHTTFPFTVQSVRVVAKTEFRN